MQLLDDIYTYGICEKKLDKTIKKIRKGKLVPGLWLVTLPLFEDGILEIYDYNQLLQPFYKSMKDKIYVVGVSLGRAGANDIVTDIVQEMCDGDYNYNVKEFFGI